MGQKVNPTGFRLPVNRAWRSRWFAPKKAFADFLVEDQKIRAFVKKRFVEAALSKVLIERYANRVRVSLFSARPGVIIGKKGQDVDLVRTDLEKLTKKEVYLEIKEVRDADADAQLVAESGRHQDPRLGPHQRRGDRARRMGPRGQGPAAHAAGEHRLRVRGGQHHRRQDRREGVDLQAREFPAEPPSGGPPRARRTGRARRAQGAEVSHAVDAQEGQVP